MTAPAPIIPFVLAAAWELPQSLLGLALYLWCKWRGGVIGPVEPFRGRIMVRTRAAGISLGLFVFWCRESAHPAFVLDDRNRLHEFGHAVQSRYLGPLYLFAVGIPSASRAIYARYHYRRHGRSWNGYYDGYPERWADRLGGVRR